MPIVPTDVPMTAALCSQTVDRLCRTYPAIRCGTLTTTAFGRPVRTMVLGRGERQGEGLNTFYGYDEDDIHLLSIEKAEAFFTAEDKTYAVMDDGRRYRIRCRLYELEEKLPAQFIRISKSAIANRRAMARLETQLSGAVNVVFKSGYVDYVSRRCFADMKRRYGL